MERRWRGKEDKVRQGKGAERRREERSREKDSEGAKIIIVSIHPSTFISKLIPGNLRLQSDSDAGKSWC